MLLLLFLVLGPVRICVRVMMFIRKCTKSVPAQVIVLLFV